MHVLVAFDKFKDALTATAACRIAAEVLQTTRPDWSLDLAPLADGGEGFATILTMAAAGTWQDLRVTGPRGESCASGFGLIDPDRIPPTVRRRLDLGEIRALAVMEMATASGLQSLAPAHRDPWLTDTRGTGEVMQTAVAAGADAVLLGVGGSATNDAGLGALSEWGWQAFDDQGSPVTRFHPGNWATISRLVPGIRPWPAIRIACDVANPLLGPRGATAVYGAQKGLLAADFDRLESAMARMARLIGEAAGRPGLEATPGAGAAGGIAYGLLTGGGARLVPGFELVTDWLGLEAKLQAADLVITGEGCFDESSWAGKGPGALARRAIALGKPVRIFAGAVTSSWRPAGCELHAITPEASPLAEALRTTREHLADKIRHVLAA